MLSRLSGLCAQSAQLRVFVTPIRLWSTSSLRAARTNFGRQFAEQGIGVRAGPTLRERLLGPTTGKPFIYGTYALAGASLFGMGMLCYYGLGLSKSPSIITNSAFWPQYVRDRLKHTYGYLVGSLAVTGASAVAAARSPAVMRLMASGSLVTLLVSLAAIVGTGMVVRAIDYDNTVLKHAAWLAHAAVFGAVLAPMCFLGGPVLIRAAWYTAGIAAGLSLTAMTAPSEKFLMMSGPLAMGLGVVFMANIGTFFLPPGSAIGASLASIVVYGGLILFSAFLLHDTQRVVKVAEGHPTVSHGRYGQYDNFNYPQVRSYDPINALQKMECQIDKNEHLRHLLSAPVGVQSRQQRRECCQKHQSDWALTAERTARRWFAKFRDGEFGIEDAQRSGRPMDFDEDRVEALLPEDNRQACRKPAEELGCNHQTKFLTCLRAILWEKCFKSIFVEIQGSTRPWRIFRTNLTVSESGEPFPSCPFSCEAFSLNLFDVSGNICSAGAPIEAGEEEVSEMVILINLTLHLLKPENIPQRSQNCEVYSDFGA